MRPQWQRPSIFIVDPCVTIARLGGLSRARTQHCIGSTEGFDRGRYPIFAPCHTGRLIPPCPPTNHLSLNRFRLLNPIPRAVSPNALERQCVRSRMVFAEQ